MITRIQALNFRSLRYIDQLLSPFHVLVGPNASGKTTFLDVVAFLGDFVSEGLDFAVEKRTQNLSDLIWSGKYDGEKKDRFELAIEASIPTNIQSKFSGTVYETIRYEVAIGINDKTGENTVLAEKVLLKKQTSSEYVDSSQKQTFPFPIKPPKTILTTTPKKLRERVIVKKNESGTVSFFSETVKQPSLASFPYFKLSEQKSALGNLHDDEKNFPASIWLKNLLAESVQQIILNSLLIRQASKPGQKRRFMPDGSNLPWVVQTLKDKSPERFKDWVLHIRTALPDIQDITTDEFPDTKFRYLKVKYSEGFEVPSWTLSDGTLRLLALTLPAYLIDFKGVYLIEEPENGIHPKAVDTMFQSLSSAYDAQILLATHSPVVLSIAEAKDLLCFAKAGDGATDIVSGSRHPRLREWKGETNLGVLFASGVLG
jgi:predicted ATPase